MGPKANIESKKNREFIQRLKLGINYHINNSKLSNYEKTYAKINLKDAKDNKQRLIEILVSLERSMKYKEEHSLEEIQKEFNEKYPIGSLVFTLNINKKLILTKTTSEFKMHNDKLIVKTMGNRLPFLFEKGYITWDSARFFKDEEEMNKLLNLEVKDDKKDTTDMQANQ